MAEAKNNLFDSELQELAQMYKALAHPARLHILRFLASRNTCFSGDISEELPLGRTTVNQHLSELKKVDLIKGTVNGSKTNYCLNSDTIKKVAGNGFDFLNQLTKECNTSC